jgi:hypothetical protein
VPLISGISGFVKVWSGLGDFFGNYFPESRLFFSFPSYPAYLFPNLVTKSTFSPVV